MTQFGTRGAILAAGFGLCLAAAPAIAQTVKPAEADPIVATVDGEPIHRSEVAQVRRSLPPQFQELPLEVLFPVVIERLIDGKLVANAGRKEKLQDDADVKRRVAQFEDRVIQEVYINAKVEGQITDDKLRERYDAFVKANPAKEEIRARHILVRTESEAKQVIADLGKGEEFAKVASARSIDPSGKQQGGDLGFFSKEDMVPEFSEAAFAMQPGQTSQAPVKSQFGWHVIMVEERRTNAPSFEEVKENLVAEITQEIVTGEVGRLRNSATIERFNLDGSAAGGASSAPAR
jgi:peptidyl-prolyl cis-trans isomerase C